MAKKSEELTKIRKLKNPRLSRDRKELEVKVDELRSAIVKTRVEIATGKEKNYSKLGKLKKEIARYLTVLKEK